MRRIAILIAILVLATAVFALSQHGTSEDLTPPPGAVNPQVSQETIYQTICVRGWTRKVRPPSQYTQDMKVRQMQQRHLSGAPQDYEEDHFVPLELGGDPWSPRNLWPQPLRQAQVKNGAEARLHNEVCAGQISLVEAQREIRDPRNWEAGQDE